MKNYIVEINKLKDHSKYISTYKSDKKVIATHLSKIPGSLDKSYIDFLYQTNGASILDYAFLGLKNNQLGQNVYDNIIDLWELNPMLCLRFWGCVGTSTNEYFGYLDIKDSNGNYFWGYYSEAQPEQIQIIASSFDIFFIKFLHQIKQVLDLDKDAIGIDKYWFNTGGKLSDGDNELAIYLSNHSPIIYL